MAIAAYSDASGIIERQLDAADLTCESRLKRRPERNIVEIAINQATIVDRNSLRHLAPPSCSQDCAQ
jgi:hypothetical protein